MALSRETAHVPKEDTTGLQSCFVHCHYNDIDDCHYVVIMMTFSIMLMREKWVPGRGHCVCVVCTVSWVCTGFLPHPEDVHRGDRRVHIVPGWASVGLRGPVMELCPCPGWVPPCDMSFWDRLFPPCPWTGISRLENYYYLFSFIFLKCIDFNV